MTWTRLHDACQHQRTIVVEQLARERVEEALMTDDHGSIPLHIACVGNPPLSVIQALLKARPMSVCQQDVDGNTPLHIAASQPHIAVDIIRALLDSCPASVYVKNNEGLMPLHMACRYAPKNDAVLECLMEAHPEALECRTKMGEMARSRVEKSSEDQEYRNGHLQFVSDLAGKTHLESSATRYSLGDQIRDGSFPMLMAIQNGASCHVIEKMLARHREEHLLHLTNKYYETALHLALMRTTFDDGLIPMLLQTSHGSLMVQTREAKHGNLPIHIAAMMGCSESIIMGLLSIYPDSIFDKNSHGVTPLDLALEYGRCNEEIVRLLEISEHI